MKKMLSVIVMVGIAIVIIVIALLSCSTPGLVDLKADFSKTNTAFDKQDDHFFTEIAERQDDINEFQEKALSQDISEEEIFKWIDRYREDWKDVQSEYDKLNKKFVELGKSADAFFNKNYEMINGLRNNDPHKKRLLEKHNELKNGYLDDFVKARQEISNLHNLIEDAFYSLTKLEIINSMEELNSNLGEFATIFYKAESLRTKLSMFSEDSNILIERKLDEL